MMNGNQINQTIEKGKQEALFLIREIAGTGRGTILKKMFLSLDKGVLTPDVSYIRARLMAENQDILAGMTMDDPQALSMFALITGRLMQLQACMGALERMAQAGDQDAPALIHELARLEPLLARLSLDTESRALSAS